MKLLYVREKVYKMWEVNVIWREIHVDYLYWGRNYKIGVVKAIYPGGAAQSDQRVIFVHM